MKHIIYKCDMCGKQLEELRTATLFSAEKGRNTRELCKTCFDNIFYLVTPTRTRIIEDVLHNAN